MTLRPVPRSVRCTGCGAWIHPPQWGAPGDLELLDAVSQTVLCEGCAARAAEAIGKVGEERKR